MSERIFRFFQDPGDGMTLRAGGAPITFAFNASPADGVRHRLFFAGESTIYKFWKNEPDFPGAVWGQTPPPARLSAPCSDRIYRIARGKWTKKFVWGQTPPDHAILKT